MQETNIIQAGFTLEAQLTATAEGKKLQPKCLWG